MTDEDKHTQIMVAIGKLKTTIEETVKPAVSQVYENQRAILTLNNDAKHSKDSRGRLISYAAILLSVAMTVMSWIRLNKIH